MLPACTLYRNTTTFLTQYLALIVSSSILVETNIWSTTHLSVAVLRVGLQTVMGGKVGTKLLTVEQLGDAAKLPTLDVMQATLVSLLSAPSQKVYQTLQSSQQDLVGALLRHAAPEKDDSKGEDTKQSE